jgi:hypothetical protein
MKSLTILQRSWWLGALLLLLAACSTPPTPTTQNSASARVTPVFAFSEAVVGPNRIAIGLLQNGSPLNDPTAKVRLRFFDLNDPSATVKVETDATYFGQGLPAAVYVAYPTLNTAGDWGVEVQTTLTGQSEPMINKLRLAVLPKSTVPNIGEPAPSTTTATINDVPDPAQLSSDGKPDPALYQISLDQALQSGKPTAVFFATPAFCRTAVCGPGLQVVQQLQKTYGDRINMIHVEVYQYPFGESFNNINQAAQAAAQAQRPITIEEFSASYSAPMVAWGLATEPWLYLIDAKGIIVARYEGGITREELTPAFERLAAGEPVVQGVGQP